ncbi:hypothetical protein [Lacrimispora amygdalina]|uniref:hypothetical protein n=1 Tax=Lacrimispora amygdalina TaxID=253257 RepID=UPI00140832DF|nr:hypothetical protein [Lacrimispora amygdalina]
MIEAILSWLFLVIGFVKWEPLLFIASAIFAVAAQLQKMNDTCKKKLNNDNTEN